LQVSHRLLRQQNINLQIICIKNSSVHIWNQKSFHHICSKREIRMSTTLEQVSLTSMYIMNALNVEDIPSHIPHPQPAKRHTAVALKMQGFIKLAPVFCTG
jgi:hypothetical protein